FAGCVWRHPLDAPDATAPAQARLPRRLRSVRAASCEQGVRCRRQAPRRTRREIRAGAHGRVGGNREEVRRLKYSRMLPRVAWFVGWLFASIVGRAADYPKAHEGDVVLRDFAFRSGESLAELRLHYHVLGQPQRDAAGVVRNAVLIMHGTGGAGKNLLRAEF